MTWSTGSGPGIRGSHRDLETRFTKWRAGLLAPDSFLKAGSEIEASDLYPIRDGNYRAWRLVYDTNQRR